jgi:hypothetical protein
MTAEEANSLAFQPQDIFFQFLDQALLTDGIMR